MSILVKVISKGFLENQKQLPETITDFWQYRHALEVVDGLVLSKNRIVIPKELMGLVLNSLHSAHQGVSFMQLQAGVAVF